MKVHYSIVFPAIEGMDVRVKDFYTDKTDKVALAKAKDFIVGAVLRGDFVILNEEFPTYVGVAISVFDKAEVDRAKKFYAENGMLP